MHRNPRFYLFHPPLRVRIARKARLLLWLLLFLLLVVGGMFFGPDAQEEELVTAEVEHAAAMVRQQVKVEQALQVAGKGLL